MLHTAPFTANITLQRRTHGNALVATRAELWLCVLVAHGCGPEFEEGGCWVWVEVGLMKVALGLGVVLGGVGEWVVGG